MNEVTEASAYSIAILTAGATLLGVLITGLIAIVIKWLDFKSASALENRKIRLQKLETLSELFIEAENLCLELFSKTNEFQKDPTVATEISDLGNKLLKTVNDLTPRMTTLAHAYGTEAMVPLCLMFVDALQEYLERVHSDTLNGDLNYLRSHSALEKVNDVGSRATERIAEELRSLVT